MLTLSSVSELDYYNIRTDTEDKITHYGLQSADWEYQTVQSVVVLCVGDSLNFQRETACVVKVCDVGVWCVSGDENKELGDPFTLEDVFKLTPRKFSAHWLPGITTSCGRHQR